MLDVELTTVIETAAGSSTTPKNGGDVTSCAMITYSPTSAEQHGSLLTTVSVLNLYIVTGPPSDYINCIALLSLNKICMYVWASIALHAVVCRRLSSSVTRVGGRPPPCTWPVWRRALHGGTVRLRPVRATPCFMPENRGDAHARKCGEYQHD